MSETNPETPALEYTPQDEVMILRARVADVMAIDDTETDPGGGVAGSLPP
jgi:hypothetical protein